MSPYKFCLLNILLILIFPLVGYTQNPVLELKKEFEKAANDTAFASQNTDEDYRIITIRSGDNYRDSLLLNSEPGKVIILKRMRDDALVFYKVTEQKNDTIIRASEIYLPDDLIKNPEEMADSLLMLLKNGASFEKLADQYGKDGTATEGGDLGWVKKGSFVKSFEKAVIDHNPGEYFKVFTEEYGWYVGKTTGFKLVPAEVKVVEMIKKFKE